MAVIRTNVSCFDWFGSMKKLLVHVFHAAVHSTASGHLGFLAPVDAISDNHQRVVGPRANGKRVGHRVTCVKAQEESDYVI